MDLTRSVLDPFTRSSCVPDGSKYLTPFTTKMTGTVTTGTGSSYSVFAGLMPDAFYATDSAGTTATVKVPTNWTVSPAVTTVDSLYKQYRLVSAGIRVWYTGSTLNDQGVLVFGQLSSQNTLQGLDGGSLSTLTSFCTNYKTCSLRSGGQFTWRPEDLHSQADLWDVDTVAQANSTTMNHPWLFVSCFGATTGGASSIQYEIVANYEGQIGNQNFVPGGQSPTVAEAAPGWYEKVSNMIASVPAYMPYLQSFVQSADTVMSAYNGSFRPGPGMRRRLEL